MPIVSDGRAAAFNTRYLISAIRGKLLLGEPEGVEAADLVVTMLRGLPTRIHGPQADRLMDEILRIAEPVPAPADDREPVIAHSTMARRPDTASPAERAPDDH